MLHNSHVNKSYLNKNNNEGVEFCVVYRNNNIKIVENAVMGVPFIWSMHISKKLHIRGVHSICLMITTTTLHFYEKKN